MNTTIRENHTNKLIIKNNNKNRHYTDLGKPVTREFGLAGFHLSKMEKAKSEDFLYIMKHPKKDLKGGQDIFKNQVHLEKLLEESEEGQVNRIYFLVSFNL